MTCDKISLLKSNIVANLEDVLKKMGVAQRFMNIGKVAVKLHMGEYGNLHYIRPPIVGKIVEILERLGNSPFLFDTPTFYPGSKDTPAKYLSTANKNGFCEEVIGCPILISDVAVKVQSNGFLGSIEVAKELYEADGILVLSHCKGHRSNQPIYDHSLTIKIWDRLLKQEYHAGYAEIPRYEISL